MARKNITGFHGYTKTTLAKKIDVGPQTILHWTAIGLLKPDFDTPSGTGHSKLYGERNVTECLFIKRFQMMGYDLQKIARILPLIRQYLGTTLLTGYPDLKLLYYQIQQGEEQATEGVVEGQAIDSFFKELGEKMKGAYKCEIINIGALKKDLIG